MSGLEKATPIRLVIDDEDIYMQDNSAYCILNPPRVANVLIVSDYNKYLELVTQTDRIQKIAKVQYEDREYLKDKQYLERATLGFYDLIIFDQCSPEQNADLQYGFLGGHSTDRRLADDSRIWRRLPSLMSILLTH